MAPLVAQLLASGLSLLGNAVLTKGKEVVEEKLGVKLPDGDQALTSEQIVTLKQAEMQHEEWLINAGIRQRQQEIENTDGARDMNTCIQETSNATRFVKEAAYYLDFLVIGSTLFLAGVLLFQAIPTANKELIYTVLGALLAQCATILNFHRGSSAQSHGKDATIAKLSEGR